MVSLGHTELTNDSEASKLSLPVWGNQDITELYKKKENNTLRQNDHHLHTTFSNSFSYEICVNFDKKNFTEICTQVSN